MRAASTPYIIGEHGDSEVPVWSSANIAGMRLPQFCQAQGIAYDPQAMEDIFLQTRDAAYHIIERKGATYYAVAAGLMRITRGDPARPKYGAIHLQPDSTTTMG